MSSSVTVVGTPPEGLLTAYDKTPQCHTDCYRATVVKPVNLHDYILAFYDSSAFIPERMLIGFALGRKADREEVRCLANGEITSFSAWTVESRTLDEILLADISGATRSWLKVERTEDPEKTTLYFGSAVVPRRDQHGRNRAPSLLFTLLTPFHVQYSKVLLAAAV